MFRFNAYDQFALYLKIGQRELCRLGRILFSRLYKVSNFETSLCQHINEVFLPGI